VNERHKKDATLGVTIGDLVREQFKKLEKGLSDVTKRQIKAYQVLERLTKGEKK
jgi:hypothetical protein